MFRRIAFMLLLALLCVPRPGFALDSAIVLSVATGDSDEKIAAIYELAATGEDDARKFLEALSEGRLKTIGDQTVGIETDGEVRDAVTGVVLSTPPETMEDVIANNRLRREVSSALAGMDLFSEDKYKREEAAKVLEENVNPLMKPLIRKAISKEKNTSIRSIFENIMAGLELSDPDPMVRLASVKILGESDNPRNKILLSGLLRKDGEEWVEQDEGVRAAASEALRSIESSLRAQEELGNLFSGISLGSILLLAALGLAITYGLMGVINMAHGELIMIGAYATYVVQNFFRANFADYFSWYPLAAIPAAFLVSAIIGIVIERAVIRFLYGRTLETLLATWGISLFLIQATRSLFGAQNVAVENPSWLSGGYSATPNLVLPYNRLAIILFTVAVLFLVWLLLTRTRLGLYVRAVTQNRAMAGCVGVSTPKIDMLAFGLGSGVAGLAGCALSQVGNVGPALGQGYIVDSFMVVVLGGVGQLAGTAWAALGLGVANKFLESWSGAVLAKIMILVFIIIFIQRRPQGLFALKGRTTEN